MPRIGERRRLSCITVSTSATLGAMRTGGEQRTAILLLELCIDRAMGRLANQVTYALLRSRIDRKQVAPRAQVPTFWVKGRQYMRLTLQITHVY